MSFELKCRKCGTAYVLDRAFAGLTLPCPSCGAPDGLAAAPVARRVKVASVPTPGVPVAASARSAAPAATAKRVATAAQVVLAPPAPVAPRPEEVVCPRCKMHFVPSRTVSEAADGTRPVVLVVEDMDYFRQVAAEALGSRFEVRQAASVAEARAQLTPDVDLMVLDLTLDGGDHGIDILRGLSGRRCPVLIYTDQDESAMYGDSWEELQRLGADDIVMKGMHAGETLLRKVSALLGIPWDHDE